jgi:hypothetical protein
MVGHLPSLVGTHQKDAENSCSNLVFEGFRKNFLDHWGVSKYLPMLKKE